ncbi:MAG TPA: DUF4184 family protein [Burkholderiales bacterium]
MPYPFAHPAAVLPLARPLGRFAVPSALAIGSIAPDLWHFVPLVDRAHSHGAEALLWFCLPVGLAAYLLFHLVLKAPLIALVWPRLGVFTTAGLPSRSWLAVVTSIVAGAATHLIWDALTHSNDLTLPGPNWAQHASTIAGTVILAGWGWRKLRAAPKAPPGTGLPVFFRACVALATLGAMTIAALWSADSWLAFDLPALRHLFRTAGLGALDGLALALLVYCALFQRKMP